MFGIGETELVIIVVFAFLLFGPDKLPGMGRTLGRVLRQFREASDGFTEVVQTNIMDPAAEELEKSPKQRKREEQAASAEGEPTEAVVSSEEPAPKRETFAERKARLMAERKAAEEAAAQKSEDTNDQIGAQPEDSFAKASDSNESLFADEAQSQVASEQEGGVAEQPKHSSAADLYAMTAQKSSRMQAKEAKQSEAEESTPREEGGDA